MVKEEIQREFATIQILTQAIALLLINKPTNWLAVALERLQIAINLLEFDASEITLISLLQLAVKIGLFLQEAHYHDAVHSLCERCLQVCEKYLPLYKAESKELAIVQAFSEFKYCQTWQSFFLTLSTQALSNQEMRSPPPDKVKAELIKNLLCTVQNIEKARRNSP